MPLQVGNRCAGDAGAGRSISYDVVVRPLGKGVGKNDGFRFDTVRKDSFHPIFPGGE